MFSTDDGTNVCYTDCSVITTVDDDGHNYSYHYYKTLNPVYRLAALIQLNPASEYGYIPGFNPPVSMNSYKEEGKMILMFTDGNSVQVIVMSLKGIFVIDFYNTSADDDALVSFKNKAMEQFDLLESIKESEMKKIRIEVYN